MVLALLETPNYHCIATVRMITNIVYFNLKYIFFGCSRLIIYIRFARYLLITNIYYMSRLMGKPKICICENKDADQLRGNHEADQRLCFRYTDSTLPLLFKSEISRFQLISVLVQAALCRTCSETTLLVFPRCGSYYYHHHFQMREKDKLCRSFLFKINNESECREGRECV